MRREKLRWEVAAVWFGCICLALVLMDKYGNTPFLMQPFENNCFRPPAAPCLPPAPKGEYKGGGGKMTEYKAVMFFLKCSEGYSDTVYKCPAGFRTVGYGYNIDANGMTSYLKDNQVTQAEATALLKYEYEAEIAKYGRLLSHRTLREVKAVALLGFNIKEGKFRFSGLFEELEKPKVNGKKVRSLWMQYCHYRDTKGRWRTSRGLRDRRVLELDLFFGRMDRVLKAGRRFERDLSLAHKGG